MVAPATGISLADDARRHIRAWIARATFAGQQILILMSDRISITIIEVAPDLHEAHIERDDCLLSLLSAPSRQEAEHRALDAWKRGWTMDPTDVQQALLSGQKRNEMIDQHCIVRTYSAGVFAGTLTKREGKEVTLKNVRRLWYWDGAASLSQLAMEGTKAPSNCKFAMPVDTVLLLEAIEIIPTTVAAQRSIEEVPAWKR